MYVDGWVWACIFGVYVDGYEGVGWRESIRPTQLHVRSKAQPLGHGDIPIRLEQHHGHRPSRLHIADDKLSDDIQPNLNVGRCLDHPNRHHPDHRHDQREEKRPPRQMRRIPLRDTQRHPDHDQRNGPVPPQRDGAEARHQSGVDVLVFSARVTHAGPEFFAVEQGGVDQDGDDACEGEAVVEGEGGGEEEGRVGFVLGVVEGHVRGQDLGDVVYCAGVVVAGAVADREVLEVEDAGVVQCGGDDPEPDDHSDERVGDGVPRGNERAEVEAGDDGPVQGHRKERGRLSPRRAG